MKNLGTGETNFIVSTRILSFIKRLPFTLPLPGKIVSLFSMYQIS